MEDKRRIRMVDWSRPHGEMCTVKFFEFPRNPVGVNPYNANRAYNAFFHNSRTQHNEVGNIWYDADHVNILSHEEQLEKYGDIETIFLTDIYEFFKVIGFDNKTKKYAKNHLT